MPQAANIRPRHVRLAQAQSVARIFRQLTHACHDPSRSINSHARRCATTCHRQDQLLAAPTAHPSASAHHSLLRSNSYSRVDSGARAYNQSKLANVLFTYELARRVPARTITANALHSGVTGISFGAEDPATIQRLFVPFMRP